MGRGGAGGENKGTREREEEQEREEGRVRRKKREKKGGLLLTGRERENGKDAFIHVYHIHSKREGDLCSTAKIAPTDKMS